jgi:hypothetical protein
VSLKELPDYPHETEWTLFQTHYFSENLLAPGIETGISGSVARNPVRKIPHKNNNFISSFL